MEAYRKVKGPEGKCRATKEESKTRGWQPPQQNCFKVNVDATISNDKQLSGLGVVIRDSTGKSIAAAIKTTKFHGDVAYAEEETASWGFQVAKNAGLVALIIETDSQMMADLINNRRGSKNEIFQVISEIQDKTKELCNGKVQHSLRSCNVIAHTLAKLAFVYSNTVVWLDSFPMEITNVFTSLNE